VSPQSPPAHTDTGQRMPSLLLRGAGALGGSLRTRLPEEKQKRGCSKIYGSSWLGSLIHRQRKH
jgi:hypothetical protein